MDIYIREKGPPIQQMIIDDVEPCKQNVVEYLITTSIRIRVYSGEFTLYVLVCSCMLYAVVVFQTAPRFRLTKCVIGIAAGCIR